MKPRRPIRVLLLAFALLGSAQAFPAAAGPLADLRAAHERHKREIRAAHERHVRAIERAHARHVRYAPEPIRKLDRMVQERHRAHRGFVRSALGDVEERHAAHLAGAASLLRQRPSAHPEHVAAVKRSLNDDGPLQLVEERHAADGGALGGIGARVETAHRRHKGALERFADWLVGA